jgi:hypothetical protein
MDDVQCAIFIDDIDYLKRSTVRQPAMHEKGAFAMVAGIWGFAFRTIYSASPEEMFLAPSLSRFHWFQRNSRSIGIELICIQYRRPMEVQYANRRRFYYRPAARNGKSGMRYTDGQRWLSHLGLGDIVA